MYSLGDAAREREPGVWLYHEEESEMAFTTSEATTKDFFCIEGRI